MLINVKKNDYKVRIVSKYGALQIRDLSVSTHAQTFTSSVCWGEVLGQALTGNYSGILVSKLCEPGAVDLQQHTH